MQQVIIILFCVCFMFDVLVCALCDVTHRNGFVWCCTLGLRRDVSIVLQGYLSRFQMPNHTLGVF